MPLGLRIRKKEIDGDRESFSLLVFAKAFNRFGELLRVFEKKLVESVQICKGPIVPVCLC